MKGWKRDRVIQALESCGFHAKVLQQKSLLTIDYKEYVGMHDHIEEMGRNIVRRLHPNARHKHSRLWKKEENEDILANDLKSNTYNFNGDCLASTEETKCVSIYTSLHPYILIKGLGKMKKLRFLHVGFSSSYDDETLELNTCSPCFTYALGYLCLPKRSSPCFLDALKYLNFYTYPFRALPNTFKPKNMGSLEMHSSNVEQHWVGGEHKVLHKLRFLDLTESNLRTLNICLAPNLEMLNLRGCPD
ncbi:hypothetical protein LXL04_016852 [Taraxacum kok-saghyz]